MFRESAQVCRDKCFAHFTVFDALIDDILVDKNLAWSAG